jgi:DNA primase
MGDFALSLGLSVESLAALSVGWAAEYRAWSFPMHDVAGNVVGIRLRRPNGDKFAVKGGREGLFIPTLERSDRLFICEGPTDTAAIFDLGFHTVVGRPNCTGGCRQLVELVQRQQPSEAVIFADGDEPGRRGASNLASVLVAFVAAVRVVVPRRCKDVREFVRAGGTRNQLEHAIMAVPVRRLSIRVVAK